MSLSNFTTSRLQADAQSDLNPSAVVSVLRPPLFEPAPGHFKGPASHKEITMSAQLHLFSIYTELGAYRRIRWAVNTIAKLAGQHWQCSSEMWKLDASNASESMRHMLASDGAKADVLIVVMRSLERRTPEIIETVEWLDSLTPLNPDRAGLLIGLLGDEDSKTEELEWTIQEWAPLRAKRPTENLSGIGWDVTPRRGCGLVDEERWAIARAQTGGG